MRNAVREYLYYSDKEKQDLWNHATFVFDTNVFLNLYRYTGKTRKLLLSALEELKDRLWMPNQVAIEFMKNRNSIIWETNHQYDTLHSEADKFIELCRSSLKLDQNDHDLIELKEHVGKWIDAAKAKNIAVNNSYQDTILEQLLVLFDGKVGQGFSPDEMKSIETEGKNRYDYEIPPGYKDSTKQKGDKKNNVYGDLIVWKQILRYASSQKRDIILVTNDQKEDWWEILHNQTIGPRVELRREFFSETSQKFHMYSMSSFITRYESGNEVKIDPDTIDEIEFFSRVIHHKSNRHDLRQYYNSLGSDNEAKAARIRFEIMRLENKNRKRANTISYNREKYATGDMPVAIEAMIESTIANFDRDSLKIQKLQAALQETNVN